MNAFDSILYAGIGGAIIGAVIWLLRRGMVFLFPPKIQEEKDPAAQQLKDSADWLKRNQGL